MVHRVAADEPRRQALAATGRDVQHGRVPAGSGERREGVRRCDGLPVQPAHMVEAMVDLIGKGTEERGGRSLDLVGDGLGPGTDGRIDLAMPAARQGAGLRLRVVHRQVLGLLVGNDPVVGIAAQGLQQHVHLDCQLVPLLLEPGHHGVGAIRLQHTREASGGIHQPQMVLQDPLAAVLTGVSRRVMGSRKTGRA